MEETAPNHPYRVTRRSDRIGRPVTTPQLRVLATLVHLCPKPGSEATAREVARAVGKPVGQVVIILKSLTALGFVSAFDEEDGSAVVWTPTMTGRSRARFKSSNRRAVLDGIA